MLVLTRKTGEEIYLGDEVRISVVAIRGRRVTIGLAAPDDMPITRGEIHERDVSGPVLPRGQSHLVKPARFRRIRLADS